jgi:hypothetical protein
MAEGGLIEVSAHHPIGNRKSPTIAIEKKYRIFASIVFSIMHLRRLFAKYTTMHRLPFQYFL